jgi:hypothetical protein
MNLRVFWYNLTDVSEVCTVSVFRVEEKDKEQVDRKAKHGSESGLERRPESCLLGLHSDPDDGGRMYLRNISKLVLDYMTPHPSLQQRILYSRNVQSDYKLLSGFPWRINFKPYQPRKARMLRLIGILLY